MCVGIEAVFPKTAASRFINRAAAHCSFIDEANQNSQAPTSFAIRAKRTSSAGSNLIGCSQTANRTTLGGGVLHVPNLGARGVAAVHLESSATGRDPCHRDRHPVAGKSHAHRTVFDSNVAPSTPGGAATLRNHHWRGEWWQKSRRV
jgi:hypothetical protein